MQSDITRRKRFYHARTSTMKQHGCSVVCTVNYFCGSPTSLTMSRLRLRKRACLALFLFTLFIFGTMMGLRALTPSDGFSSSDLSAPGGVDLMMMPFMAAGGEKRAAERRAERRGGQVANSDDVLPPAASEGAGESQRSRFPPPRGVSDTKIVFSNSGPEKSIFYDIHIFYYLWYGTPQMDGSYVHWDHVLVPHWDPKIAAGHPKGKQHAPPEDIASSYYPELGPYSSRDPDVIELHMSQIEAAAAGVVVLAWYPPGMADDHGEPHEDLVPAVMDAAHRHRIKVAFHIQPYKGRTDLSMHDNVKYIIDKYGDHGAFYRFRASSGKVLPLFYVYDSYLTPAESWAELLTPPGAHSLRGTPYDALFLGLMVEERHLVELRAAGFDGVYTYFASNGFSFGSSHHNWKAVKTFCDAHGLLFVPGAGPGYADTAVRPWNDHNTRNRVNGRYYETALQAAVAVRPELVAITSFNQWHEGTQIERAVPKKTATRVYLDYTPFNPDLYLDITRRWALTFSKEKEQWLL
ncbi:glycoprotein endo-alpha-1,2-mannosidase-like protein [Engraulis encrasicolus]|uniref:glycoprotein endo-alpha-1,2-mannosidase-like protein n=1 Tax=Engraulis encrasicolus TaxID=184585 RepID=UPI002FCF5867